MQLIYTFINAPAYFVNAHHFGDVINLMILWLGMYVDAAILSLLGLAFIGLIRNFLPLIGFILRKRGVGGEDTTGTFLELTFPYDHKKSAHASRQLHILMQDQFRPSGRLERLAARKKRYSFELVGTREKGIRYVVMVPTEEVDTISRHLLSFSPGLKIQEVSDYLPDEPGTFTMAVELQLAADFVLPLEGQEAVEEHDPMAYFFGQMTKLSPTDLIALQFVTSPVHAGTHHRVTRHVRKLRQSISDGMALGPLLRPIQPVPHWITLLVFPPLWVLLMAVKLIISLPRLIIDPDSPNLTVFEPSRRVVATSVDPFEEDLKAAIKGKLDQQLFETSVRVYVQASSPAKAYTKTTSIVSAFNPFANGRQRFAYRRTFGRIAPPEQLIASFRHRQLSNYILALNPIISSSELGDLYHLPNTDLKRTAGLVHSRSRELSAPLSHKSADTSLDVIMGQNQYAGETNPIGMTLEQRQKHTYILGKTGMGKTTLITSAIYQDMVNGKGLAVLDPHGDMFKELLQIVPEHRRKDVVVFDPSDRAFPIGLNLLDPGIEFDRLDDKHEWITSTVISIFQKLAAKEQWGPRMEHILRYATLTALQLPDPTLYNLQRLLTEKQYQKDVTEKLSDPILKQFWSEEFALLGTMQMGGATSPLTHRLGHFIGTKMSRHILLQQKSTISISDIMNDGKILLVNLSKGDLGEDQSAFFGTIITSLIWMAAYQRAKRPEASRRDFFVYVDEFQNFATPRFSEIISEGRKFHVSLILSHQNVAQIEDQNILKVVSGNANTIICLSAGPDDEDFILPFMKPEVEKGDIVNLPPYHFFMKVHHTTSESAYSGQTVPLAVKGSQATEDSVISRSRVAYGTPIATVEAYLGALITVKPKKKSPKRTPDAPKHTQEKAF